MMCGIAGFVDNGCEMSADELRHTVGNMIDTLRLRGPDDLGSWIDERAGVALGHRRLSVIDLSPSGHQPMMSYCGRYIMVFNGEIYNFNDIRKGLNNGGAGVNWRGSSDTEVLLAAISIWGIERALKQCNGMFAFALWDRKKRVLTLARDRLGEKPLYYGWMNGVFLFGSELKALRAHLKWCGEIDRSSIVSLLRYNCIPAPSSIYKDILKLPPATYMNIDFDKTPNTNEFHEYWFSNEIAQEGLSKQLVCGELEMTDRLNDLLFDSVKMRTISDVPLGAFLSGGIDSSTIVAMMQYNSSKPIKTFTIGFDAKCNEANYAKNIADYLGTDHTELYVSSSDALAVIPRLPFLYDEPFSDSSQIPTYLISLMTRKHVTVALSGDGGDELFGGYNRHVWAPWVWSKTRWIPNVIRSFLCGFANILPASSWEVLFAKLQPVIPKKIRYNDIGNKFQKLFEVVRTDSPAAMYKALVSHWQRPAEVVIGGSDSTTESANNIFCAQVREFSQHMMYLDMVTYLPDDILVKVDRASMGVSLEVRVPMLDHRVVEFSSGVPLSMKIKNGKGKWLLKQVLNKYVPSRLVDRPKAGFGIPLEQWLRDPLRDWAESLLDEQRIKQEGFFNYLAVKDKWQEHLSGKHNWQYCLWDILMFQAWLEQTRLS